MNHCGLSNSFEARSEWSRKILEEKYPIRDSIKSHNGNEHVGRDMFVYVKSFLSSY